MKERLLKTDHGTYHLQTWDGVNASGIKPVGDKVLVLVDPAQEKVGSIIINTDIAERQTLASTTGIAIALGQTAFAWDGARLVEWDGEKPVAGDRVYFQRYAGQEYAGLDGKLYRLMEDRSIAGVELQDVQPVAIGLSLSDDTTMVVTQTKRHKAA